MAEPTEADKAAALEICGWTHGCDEFGHVELASGYCLTCLLAFRAAAREEEHDQCKKCEDNEVRLIDAEQLHLADEQTIRNLNSALEATGREALNFSGRMQAANAEVARLQAKIRSLGLRVDPYPPVKP